MTSDYMMLCEARTCYSTINPYWGLAKPSLLRSRPGGVLGASCALSDIMLICLNDVRAVRADATTFQTADSTRLVSNANFKGNAMINHGNLSISPDFQVPKPRLTWHKSTGSAGTLVFVALPV